MERERFGELASEREDVMAGLSEEDIRNRAYVLWQQAGEPPGRMDTFWYEAEKELLAERRQDGEMPLDGK